MPDFSVYILECADGSLYVGHSDDIRKRVAEHNAGIFRQCYTASRLPVRLVWQQIFHARNDAFRAERQVKGWSKAKKLALINGNWSDISVFAKSYGTALPPLSGRPSTGSG